MFDAVRSLQRNSRDLPVRLEASPGGWFEALPDEHPDDPAGHRPLGAVRRELADLIAAPDSDLTGPERTVVGAYYGLHVYPADLDGPIDPVTARVVRRRGGRHDP